MGPACKVNADILPPPPPDPPDPPKFVTTLIDLAPSESTSVIGNIFISVLSLITICFGVGVFLYFIFCIGETYHWGFAIKGD